MHVVVAIALLVSFALPQGSPSSYEELKAGGERYYAEGSYALSRTSYLAAQKLAPTPAEKRWVDFRLADTRWRAFAATENSDQTELLEARRHLVDLAEDPPRVEDRDRVWAEAHESLGDSFHLMRNARDWGSAWGHYSVALDWWAGRTDVEAARLRYLGMVFKIADPTCERMGGVWLLHAAPSRRGGECRDDRADRRREVPRQLSARRHTLETGQRGAVRENS
jgi:hypothetical protein